MTLLNHSKLLAKMQSHHANHKQELAILVACEIAMVIAGILIALAI